MNSPDDHVLTPAVKIASLRSSGADLPRQSRVTCILGADRLSVVADADPGVTRHSFGGEEGQAMRRASGLNLTHLAVAVGSADGQLLRFRDCL